MRLVPSGIAALAIVAGASVGLAAAMHGSRAQAGQMIAARLAIPDLALFQKQVLAQTNGVTLKFVPNPKLIVLDAANPYYKPLEMSLNCTGEVLPSPSVDQLRLRTNYPDRAWVWIKGALPTKYYLVTFKVALHDGSPPHVEGLAGAATAVDAQNNHKPITAAYVTHPIPIGVLITPGSNMASLGVLIDQSKSGSLFVQEVTIEEI